MTDLKSKISLELVITLIGIAFSSGVLWMKLDGIDKRVARIEDKVFPVAYITSADSTKITR